MAAGSSSLLLLLQFYFPLVVSCRSPVNVRSHADANARVDGSLTARGIFILIERLPEEGD